MKSVSTMRRTLSIALAALLLVCAISVPAFADSYVTAGSNAIVTASRLNIRSGPGTNYQSTGFLDNGYVVKVMDTRNGWARIDTGWVDLDYLKPAVQNNNGTASPTYGGHASYVTADSLNIRQGPGTSYMIVGSVEYGYPLTILEEKNGYGRIGMGSWVDLDYVSATKPSTVPGFNSNNVDNKDNLVTSAKVRVTADSLNIRQGPGTGYNRVGKLTNGTVVDVNEIRGNWGLMSQGWICLDYTVRASGDTAFHSISNGSKVEVTATTLRIRSNAGTQYQQTGVLYSGYRTTLLEVKGNWGRIDSGWICLDYVKLI